MNLRSIFYKCRQGKAGILAHLVYKRISAFLAWLILKVNPNISPNKITLLQYFLLPITISSILLLHNPLLFAFLLIVHDWLDGVDGSIARVTGKSSNLGAFFDAVTDKLIFFLAILLLAIYYRSYILPLLFFSLEALYHVIIRYYENKIAKTIIDIDYEAQCFMSKGRIVIGPTNDILYTLLLVIILLNIPIETWFLFIIISFWIIRTKKILNTLRRFTL